MREAIRLRLGRRVPKPGLIEIAWVIGTHKAVLSEFEPLQVGSILPPVDWAGAGQAVFLHNTNPRRGGPDEGD